jgi:predicted TIM-barrel fold metal-dependent hydrolase
MEVCMKKLISFAIFISLFVSTGYSQSSSFKIIDVHDHFSGWLYKGYGNGYEKAAEIAVKKMDALQIRMMFIMPTPQTVNQDNEHSVDDYLNVIKKYPDRFALLGGGGSLNIMIQQAVIGGAVTKELHNAFKAKAQELLKKGIIGFGEMAAEHFSMNPTHPYITAPPDHELFLLLADIAAEADIPIDIHMEGIENDINLPERLLMFPNNPKSVKQNIPQFEKLLMHNRNAKIIWDHVGWDNTENVTTELLDRLLGVHPNLYMSIRVVSRNIPSRPLDVQGIIKSNWVMLINKYPDRFMIGSDEFILPTEGGDHDSTGSLDTALGFLQQLPPDVAEKIGYRNAEKIFKITH